MDWIVISGLHPHDGRYELDLDGAGFTTLEWGWIKKHAGYLPLTISDGYRGADPELFATLAIIAMHRSGTVAERDVADVYARLQRAPFDTTIRLETDTVEEEADADGPPPTSSSSNGGSSGDASTTSSGSSEPDLRPTGTLGLATSESDRVTSAR